MAAGLAIGGLCAAAIGPLLGRLLFGVSAFDPLAIGGVSLVLVAAGVAASYVPARRASRLEPLTALRVE